MAPANMQPPVALINFFRLLSSATTERNRETELLLEACQSNGCFILDLRNSPSPMNESNQYQVVFDYASKVFALSKKLFELPERELMDYEMDTWGGLSIGGYKPTGKHTGVADGKRDGFENFLIPFNSLLDKPPTRNGLCGPFPSCLDQEKPILRLFEQTCHNICSKILQALTFALNISAHPGQELKYSLESAHRASEESTTSLAMLKYLPTQALTANQMGHMAHTDVGSLTLLFTSSPGLQVYDDTSSSWMPVTPEPGTVVVNVGDALQFLSNGRLTSCLHRVVPQISPITGMSPVRYALAFFQRPELDVEFKDPDGNLWTGETWHRKKYKLFRASNEEQKKTSILTGKAGFLGGLEV